MTVHRDVLFEFNLKFWNTAILIFQLEVYYKVDRLRTGLTAQQKGTITRWYSNKTSLSILNSNWYKEHCDSWAIFVVEKL